MDLNVKTAPPDATYQRLQSPPRRRQFMLAAAGLVAGATVASQAASRAAGNPDARLIALCAEFETLERQIRSFYWDGSNPIENDHKRDAVQAPLHERQELLLGEISEMWATTLEGIKARLQMIITYGPQLLDASAG